MNKPRSILITASGEKGVALCKAGPRVRNTYEIRLCLYLAFTKGKPFFLVVSPGATVDPALEAHLVAHGGQVRREAVTDHSVYLGAEDSSGGELCGWVACEGTKWLEILSQSPSDWLKDALRVGHEFTGEGLQRLRAECMDFPLGGTNIDGEPLSSALLLLIDAAESAGGSVFIQ